MIIKLRDPNTGEPRQFGIYDDAHCLRLTDIVPAGSLCDLLELTETAPGRNICRLHQVSDRPKLTRKIILAFLDVVISDLIENGNHFRLPVAGLARWRIVAKSRRQVVSIARRNKYKFVDLRKSDGKIYELIMEYRAYGKVLKRVIRLNRERYLRLCARVEEGKHYDQR